VFKYSYTCHLKCKFSYFIFCPALNLSFKPVPSLHTLLAPGIFCKLLVTSFLTLHFFVWCTGSKGIANKHSLCHSTVSQGHRPSSSLPMLRDMIHLPLCICGTCCEGKEKKNFFIFPTDCTSLSVRIWQKVQYLPKQHYSIRLCNRD